MDFSQNKAKKTFIEVLRVKLTILSLQKFIYLIYFLSCHSIGGQLIKLPFTPIFLPLNPKHSIQKTEHHVKKISKTFQIPLAPIFLPLNPEYSVENTNSSSLLQR